MAYEFSRYDNGGISVRNENVSYYEKKDMLKEVSEEYGKYADGKYIYNTTQTFTERGM